MKLNDICIRTVVTATPGESVVEAARRMRDEHVGCVVVLDGECHPIGVLTDRDIVVAVVALDLEASEVVIGDVMSTPVVAVRSRQDVEEALEIMRAAGVRRLPLIDDDGVLIGLVSADDLIERLAGACADLARMVVHEQRRERETRRIKV